MASIPEGRSVENEELVSELNQTPINCCSPSGPEWADGRGGFDSKWATETVRALSEGIDADQAFDRMPILADALEEAGCDDAELLSHCRTCPTHSTHCWVLWMIREAAEPHRSPAVSDVPARRLRSVPTPVGRGGKRGAAWLFGLVMVCWGILALVRVIRALCGAP